jgi:hypothetical protein
VGPAAFSFVWIASNELPLRDDLVPFLLTRSGKPLDEFGEWVASRMPAEWVLAILDCVAMSEAARARVYHHVKDDRPEVRARRRHLAELILADEPDIAQRIEEQARLAEARSALRRVLAGRGLLVRPEEDARIDACTDPAILERWLDKAIVAKTAAEVLGAPPRKRRTASPRRAR